MTLTTISKKDTYDLVLGGGGSHGFSHIGVLKELEKTSVSVSQIIGVSFGALVGVCLAAGKSVKDIENFFVNEKASYLLRPSFQMGLLQSKEIVKKILRFAGVTQFKELKIPFTVTATNVNTGGCHVFTSGELFKPLCASIAVPGLFSPITFDGAILIDGGVFTPVPLHLCTQQTIAIDVSSELAHISRSSSTSLLLQNAIQILQKRIIDLEHNESVILIRPPVGKYGFLEISTAKRKEMIKKGVSTAKKAFTKAKLYK